jgi:hypothetical protein
MTARFGFRRDSCVLVIAALVAAGCGGGGGGGGSSGTTSGSPSISAAYYPDAQNDTWAYDGTSTAATGPFFDTIGVTGTRPVLGANPSIFVEDNPLGSGTPTEDYYLEDARAFTDYGNNDPTDWLTAALVPYDEMLFGVPLVNLTLFDKTGVRIAQDLDGDGINDSVDARAVVNFNQFEPLATTAGTFSSAAKATATVNLTFHLSAGGTLPTVLTVTQWRAAGVGLLKEVDTTSVNGAVAETDTLDIRGFRVNGVGAGYLAPRTLASGLATASSDVSNPGRQAVGTDGTNFLLVSRQQTDIPNVVPASTKWTGRIVLTDGSVQAPFDLLPAAANSGSWAAVAFDGSNYLVLTTPNGGITGQRVSPAGSLIDAAPGISVAASASEPAIAYGGGVYLVVYGKPSAPSNLYGVMVLPSGAVGAEFTLYTGTGTDLEADPSVAFDGTNFLVAWEHLDAAASPDTANVYGARVATGGTILSAPIYISTATEAQNYPQVACDGTNCLVIWTDRRNYPGQPYTTSPGPGDIYGTRISSADSLLDGLASTGGLAIATGVTANQGYPGLAFNGTEYIAAWSRGAYVNNPGGPTGIFAARISVNGAVGWPPSNTGVWLSGLLAPATTLHYVSMAGGANGTLATWLDNIETSGTTKSISGAQIYPLASR